MTARDDYPLVGKLHKDDVMHRQCHDALNEIDRLRRWKEEALEVLSHWDVVAECFDLSEYLGEFTADAVLIEIARLQCDRLHKQLLRTELAKHGWGDFHYGDQGQDPAIMRLLEETQ